ncbi:neuronal acetylcholine receptor subunit alpha-6-like [Dreissena polymorpha]|uniref:neuronal acetylcholine receptor subunit alpha-6-like n=1 Tax=Dreissena polymorpha TaxID=45954 RepID=UPI002264EF89|nr:neuronal acetylcholine receptor subunit alpha-6-like [Dreissena polymorpha]
MMAFMIIILLALLAGKEVGAANVSDTQNLLTDLSQDYNVNIRPAVDQLSPVNVSLQMYLKSIMEFDEVQGSISYTAGFLMIWEDYRLGWDPLRYGGLTKLTVPLKQIWFPELILVSPATDRTYLANTQSKARIWSGGEVEYLEGVMIESTCDVNVKYYPFDLQSCNTSFMALGYYQTEVYLMRRTESIDLTLYHGNSMWTLESTSVSEVFFTFNLRRKPVYAVVTVLLPILFLGTLNAFVFLLIPESGERIGYSITTLLSIAVYMTIIMSTLPQSSDPTPLIFYKLLVDLAYSSLIIVAVILNMRLHAKDDDASMPKFFVSFYLALTCRGCGGKPVSPASHGFATDKNVLTLNEMKTKPDELDMPVNSVDAKKITWKKFSSLLDTIFFVLFIFYSFLSFAVFLGVLVGGA